MATAYAVLADVYNLGVPQLALASVTVPQQQAALDAANAEFESYLGQYRLPLTAWGADVKLHVSARAAFTMLTVRGYNPDDGADKNIFDRSEQALAWMKLVAKGDAKPSGLLDSSQVNQDSGSRMVAQTIVQTAFPPTNPLSLGTGGPGTTQQTSTGTLVTGSPQLRGF